jgi:OOP family OmpA-OmpF porin
MFKQFGNNKLVAVAAPISLAVGLALGASSVQAGYLTDSRGNAVTNNYGECWNALGGVSGPMEPCDVMPVAEPEPEPVAAPVPVPEPAPVVINVTGDHFDFDSAQLKPAMITLLDDVAAKAKASGVSLLVIGHTDSTGPEAYNQGLSERRAQAAANYLMDQGVSGSNITVSGMGETQPVADNSTREGRAMNRRFEVQSR